MLDLIIGYENKAQSKASTPTPKSDGNLQAKIEEFLRRKQEQEANTPRLTPINSEIDPRYPAKFYLNQRNFHKKVHHKSSAYGWSHAVFIREIWPEVTEEEMSALMSGRLNPIPQWLGLILLKKLGLNIFAARTKKLLLEISPDQP